LSIKEKTISDEELILGCIKKDMDARRLLYNKYCNLLFTVAYHIVSDRALSNDILHDSFIKIYTEIQKLENSDSLKPWMRRIVVNIALQTIKRSKKIVYCEDLTNEGSSFWPEPMSGEALDKALFMLPNGYRVIFTLIEIEGYKHHEVAKILSISEGTSKSQLFHAKKHLRKLLS
jgi:RNA polymerase sigma-70 factor, ECF subfamily